MSSDFSHVQMNFHSLEFVGAHNLGSVEHNDLNSPSIRSLGLAR